jgi:hypothetical protein
MDNDEPLDNTESLTRPRTKKDRSPAQVAAFEAMRAKLNAKQSGNKTLDPTKKAVLAMVKEKLTGPPKSTEPLPESSDEEEVVAPPKKVKASKKVEEVVAPPKPAPKKKQPIVHEIEESESEEEVIVVKKKKKPKKKTIIYEESSDEEEEEEPPAPPPKREVRETKTQQNKASRFKVTPPESKPAGPVYYFA